MAPPVLKTYTLSELSALAAVPPATIHHYLNRGLLPPPRRHSANRFLYDERHVQGLRLIRLLRERRRLPLPIIRRILPDLLDRQAEEAFRPELWDRALAPARRRHPAERILKVAKDAFGRRGYGDVNVERICEAARVAKGSFYRYYRSKEELFFAAAGSVTDDVVAAFTRALGGRPATIEEASGILATALQRRAPLFLELLTRALERRPGYVAEATRIFGRASAAVGRGVTGSGTPEERGARAIGAALAMVLLSSVASPAPREAEAGERPAAPAAGEGSPAVGT
jgi:AcrR family transcriptional regulator